MIKITRFDVYGSVEYSAKGSLVLYDHHKEVVADLERQLEEARNLLTSIDDYLGESGINAVCSTSIYHRRIQDLINKLKEQGR